MKIAEFFLNFFDGDHVAINMVQNLGAQPQPSPLSIIVG
jgi:hypothetical protein